MHAMTTSGSWLTPVPNVAPLELWENQVTLADVLYQIRDLRLPCHMPLQQPGAHSRVGGRSERRPGSTIERFGRSDKWSRHSDLNRGPAVYETAALPLSYVGPAREYRSCPRASAVRTLRIAPWIVLKPVALRSNS